LRAVGQNVPVVIWYAFPSDEIALSHKFWPINEIDEIFIPRVGIFGTHGWPTSFHPAAVMFRYRLTAGLLLAKILFGTAGESHR